MTWLLALSIAFSAWLPVSPQGPFPLGDGGMLTRYTEPWGMAMYFSPPTGPCQPPLTAGPCSPQTYRWAILETGINGLPMETLANRWVKVRWILYSNKPVTIIPIVWQAFHAEHERIFQCPPVYVDVTQWVTAECSIYLPTVEGLPVATNHGLGIGLELDNPYEGWLDVATLDVWLSQ